LRSAATAFIVGESSCREANRANSAAEMTGTGTGVVDRLVHVSGPRRSRRVTADLGQAWILFQRADEQVQQP